jgi:hypothetical protein
LLVAVCLLAAGCSHAPKEGSSTGGAGAPAKAATVQGPARDLIIGQSGSAITALTSDTGSVIFREPAVPALGDWSELYTTIRRGRHTIVRATPLAADGQTEADRVPGHLAVRTVSFDGTRAALIAPLRRGLDPWRPRPRAATTIVVANLTGNGATSRFHLEGNLDPEAFSSDDQYLFLIKYVPATAPTAYRVVALELNDGDGDVYPVAGRNKTWSPKMAGTRLQQVASPYGDMLYTLYSSQPPRYARGYDATQAAVGRPVAFVHTLNLQEHWAVCVPLPKQLWGGRSVDEAMALAPSGSDLYVVDAKRNFIASMYTTRPLATGRPRVTRSRALHLGLGSVGQVHAAVSPNNTSLTIARGHDIVTVDAHRLRVMGRTTVPGPVSGLGWSDDGKRLYVLTPGAVRLLDPSTGRQLRRIDSAGMHGIDYVGSLDEGSGQP